MERSKADIYVTEPDLPSLEECIPYFQKIWDSKVLTNNGPFVQKLEKNLANYLGVQNISLINNATSGLMLAQKALGFKGEVITTPFSFIATAHSIDWIGLTPIFVDVDPVYGNIQPHLVEKAINSRTGGILSTHNFGFPAEIEKLERIAFKNSIPLIFDAAPAMGVKYNNKSITSYGDASVLSFHATKVFTTFEGGALIAKSPSTIKKVNRLRNFNICDEENVGGPGINAKMNEILAAIGLVQLQYLDQNLKKREKRYQLYSSLLKGNKSIETIPIPTGTKYNYSYFPIYIKSGKTGRDDVFTRLKKDKIYCRKYWYPLIEKHSYYNEGMSLPNAECLADKVLSLPMGNDMTDTQICRIVKLIDSIS